MNKLIISGALGRDSELKTTAQSKSVLNFSIANNTGFGDRKKTTWYRCAMWGDRAVKLEQHFKQGTKLIIIGEFELREYEKKDGTTGVSPEIFVNDFEFMGSNNNTNNEQSAASKEANAVFNPTDDGDLDAPF